MDYEYDDDDYQAIQEDGWEEEEARRNDVYSVVNAFNKEFGTNVSLSLDTLPSCCSALVMSGIWVGGNNYKESQKAFRNKLIKLVKDITAAATPSYAFLISTLLIPRQEDWAGVLREAGFEESGQVAASNHYNGSVPLKVYIKSLRSMTEEEIEIKIKEQKEKQAKGGYEW